MGYTSMRANAYKRYKNNGTPLKMWVYFRGCIVIYMGQRIDVKGRTTPGS